MRLRKVRVDGPGLGRRRVGRGFTYLDPDGERITDPEVIARCKALVIPPAWREVWICPDPDGHLQATGRDEAGRKQYLYHPVWRAKRDRSKFDRLLEAERQVKAPGALGKLGNRRGEQRVKAGEGEADHHRELAVLHLFADLVQFLSWKA